MTDAKGAGEGPDFDKSPFDCSVYGADDIKKAYAAGVKAERERCLSIVNRHPNDCGGITLHDCLETIQEAIEGGQDGK